MFTSVVRLGNRLHGRPLRPLAVTPGLSATFLALGCGDETTDPERTMQGSLTVFPAANEIVLGDTQQLTAMVYDASGMEIAGAKILWSSSAPATATVDSLGLVRAVSVGAAVITANYDGASARADVRVLAPSATSVDLIPDTVVLSAVGDTLRPVVVVLDQLGRVIEDAPVTWSSSNDSVAIVDSAGLFLAVGVGRAWGTAASGAADKAVAVVVTQTPHSVAMSPPTATISQGDTIRLTAAAVDANGHTMAARLSWASSHPGVATVDETGLVVGGNDGVATITVQAGAAQGESQIVVGNPDRAALVAIYEATSGSNWTRRENWLTEAPLAEWEGVEVNEAGRVSVLTLHANGLSGPIPPQVTALVHLDVLELGFNELTGPIPVGIGNLVNLTALRLQNSKITGRIPSEIGALTRLETLQLGNNELSGPMPPELGRLENLRELSAYRNRLTGTIPKGLLGLRALERLDLAFNELTGALPPGIADLVALTDLDLAVNGFTGTIPGRLGELPNLQRLDLAANRLTGGIPRGLGELSNLERLSISENELTGRIPPELGNLSRLRRLTLQLNQLTGTVPGDLGRLANLQDLDLSWNYLEGPLPHSLVAIPGIARFRFDSRVFSAREACAPATPAFVAWIEKIASTHGTFCNSTDVAALERLFESAGGDDWTVSDGWLGGPALMDWHGVVADSLGRVTSLDLNGNGLVGRLPASLASLGSLSELRVAGNALSGPLPQSFTQLRLSEFVYDGTDICAPGGSFQTWLSNIPVHHGPEIRCPPLSDREILTVLYDATGGVDWPNQDGWLTEAPLGDWHGVAVDDDGQVVGLTLRQNELVGSIPPELGGLTNLRSLDLSGNLLNGSVPLALGNLSNLLTLDLGANRLSGRVPSALGRIKELEHLSLWGNEFSGPVLPQFGVLNKLESLNLGGNQLTGTIPSQLGNLASLRVLRLWGNRLNGSIPRALGRLKQLEILQLSANELTGPIPKEIADLQNLQELRLYRNRLSGSLPPEIGNFARLEELLVAGNELTGGIPPEVRKMETLNVMDLGENQLSGSIPPDIDGLADLRKLRLTNNLGLVGPLPASVTTLARLSSLHAEGTSLCVPPTRIFQVWLTGVEVQRIPSCGEGADLLAVYLMQTVQSLDFPVPLVASEPALLRVFMKASRPTSQRIPSVRATFYLDGSSTHVVEIPSGSSFLPTQIDEGNPALVASAEIPAEIILPGLEMVVDIDLEGAVDPGLGIARRVPAVGRLPLDVWQMPELDLTIIPFLWSDAPDSAIMEMVGDMADDPQKHGLLDDTRVLLPVGDIKVTAHEPVVSSSNDPYDLFYQTDAIMRIEGGPGYYMGMISGPRRGPLGLAWAPGRVSFSRPLASTIAHELGHNMSLGHAPCRTSGDPDYPYRDGSIGAWGYEFGGDGGLVPPSTPDVMSYCDPAWISDYHFSKALRHRLASETVTASVADEGVVPSLMLWGGTDDNGVPFLNPVFVVDALAALPEPGGEFELVGRTGTGDALFSFRFDPPELPDSEGRASFAFIIPVEADWAASLASITLTGPGGAVTIDGDTDQPMVILRDKRSGRVRAFLRDVPPVATSDDHHIAALSGDGGLIALFSRGLPDAEVWRR